VHEATTRPARTLLTPALRSTPYFVVSRASAFDDARRAAAAQAARILA
jgi:hypothetical protein